MKALLTEMIGTFFLVLAIGLSVNGDAALAPVSIGFTLMVVVYAGGRYSGAHYNPAVSVAAVIRGALPGGRLLSYWGAQFVGAIVASFLIWKFTGAKLHVAPAESTTMLKAIVGEAVATFALAYVVLNVAASKSTAGNHYFGLAIGATVMAMAIAMGPITGGAFNPAVGLGPAIFNAVTGDGFNTASVAYLIGPFVGAAAAGYLVNYQGD